MKIKIIGVLSYRGADMKIEDDKVEEYENEEKKEMMLMIMMAPERIK